MIRFLISFYLIFSLFEITIAQSSKIDLIISKDSTFENRLTFRLENNSDLVFTTTPFRTQENRLLIICPNGKIIEDFVYVNYSMAKDDSHLVKIAPHESKEWKLDLKMLLLVYSLDIEKNYSLLWKIDEIISDNFEIFIGGK